MVLLGWTTDSRVGLLVSVQVEQQAPVKMARCLQISILGVGSCGGEGVSAYLPLYSIGTICNLELPASRHIHPPPLCGIPNCQEELVNIPTAPICF